ncbi:MAG: hypothetical protein ACN6O1_10890 [Comamonas sp.]|uniref:phage adaptor protein n=1 Tax=Comamonas sp. TaxID=34028 RepID=UPI003D0F7427
MAAFTLADAVDDVLPHLAADPSSPVTELAIRNAAIEFCSTSGVWTYTQEDASLTAGQRAVELEPDMGAAVVRVLAVRYRGKALAPANQGKWLDEVEYGDPTGAPRFWAQNDTEQVLLHPVPVTSQAGVLEIDLALQPSRTATTVPGWIWAKWGERIVDGALARLMLMPGKPWTAPELGALHRQLFHGAMHNAQAGAITNRARAPLRTRSRH